MVGALLPNAEHGRGGARADALKRKLPTHCTCVGGGHGAVAHLSRALCPGPPVLGFRLGMSFSRFPAESGFD